MMVVEVATDKGQWERPYTQTAERAEASTLTDRSEGDKLRSARTSNGS